MEKRKKLKIIFLEILLIGFTLIFWSHNFFYHLKKFSSGFQNLNSHLTSQKKFSSLREAFSKLKNSFKELKENLETGKIIEIRK